MMYVFCTDETKYNFRDCNSIAAYASKHNWSNERLEKYIIRKYKIDKPDSIGVMYHIHESMYIEYKNEGFNVPYSIYSSNKKNRVTKYLNRKYKERKKAEKK